VSVRERMKFGKKQINIIGHPGTGKTTTLANQLMNLLEVAEPDEILATSFSRSAARRMIQKLREFGINADDLKFFRTTHSLAAAALDLKEESQFIFPEDAARFFKEHGIEYKKKHTTIDDIELYGYVGPFDIDFVLGNRLQAYYQFLKRVKIHDDAIETAIKRREFFDRFELEKHTSAWVLEIYEEWEAEKKLKGKYEYEDMLVEALEDERFPTRAAFGLVDEAQDLSPLQIKLLSLWLRDAEKVFVAFDVMQTIYFFNGSSPELILSLQKDKEIILDRSFRVPKVPWEFAKKIAKLNDIRTVEKVRPAEREGDVLFIERDNVSKVLRRHSEGTIFLLFRRNDWALDFIGDLFRKERLLLKGMGHIATLAQDKYFELQYNCILKLYHNELPTFEEIRSIITKIPAEYLKRGIKTRFVKKPEEALKLFREKKAQKALSGEGDDVSLFYSFFRRIGSVKELQEILAEPRVYFGSGRRGQFIREILTAIDENSPPFNSMNAYAGTYHSAKGLEADNVILFDYLPPRKADLFEERCLTFVGLTRTKNNAYIVPVENFEGIIERDIMR